MESKEFKFLIYSIVIGNWDHSLNIIDRLKKEVDSNQLPILTDIQKAIIARKNEDYETAKKLWKQIQIESKNLNDAMADFAKVAYYDTIADSNKKMEKKCYLKIEENCRKIGDPILILIFEASRSKKPNETAILRKKTAEKLTQAGDTEDGYYATAMYYISLAEATKKPEKITKFYKKAAEEFTKAGDAEQAHYATAWYYAWLALPTEKSEEKAELYKKAAKEFTNAEDAKGAHYATAWYYTSLADATEKPEEKAELFKKAAEEFTKAENAEEAHKATSMYFVSLAEATKKPEEKAELYKKAAEELKEIGYKEDAHKLMAKQYFFLSLSTKSKAESDRYQLLASGETKLGWLYVTQIAFDEYKKSKTINTTLLELTIELYKKYLRFKNKQFPVSSVYLCGDITDSTKQITSDMSEYFKFNITSFPRGRFKNTPLFKKEVKKDDFVLMELNEDIENELLYELGLVAGMGKPMMVLRSGNINYLDEFIPKIVTVTSNRKFAFTALKLFSVIKSGESLEIADMKEKSAIDELMRGFKEKPLFTSQFELDKSKFRGLHGERL